MTKLLTKKELAALLGISQAGINKMIMRRKIPYLKVTASPHGPVRFDAAAIEVWLKQQTIRPTAQA